MNDRALRLTPEETADLSRAWRHRGDHAARDRLVEAYLPLADGLAARRGRAHDRADLRSEAREALLRAADAWDPDRAGRSGFVGFASIAIRRAIRVDAARWRSVVAGSRGKIERALSPGRDRPEWLAGDVELDAPVSDGDGRTTTRLDALADDAPGPDEDAAEAEELARIRAALEQLAPRERHVLVRRAEGATLDDVGAEVGLSGERVRIIEAEAVRAVRFALGLVREAPRVPLHRGRWSRTNRTAGAALAGE